MDNNLYVIVHEKSVRRSVPYRPMASKVLQEIERIKSTERFISHEEEPTWINENMPGPSAGLKVRMVGAYAGLCVAIHKELLENLGYCVEMHGPGCLDA